MTIRLPSTPTRAAAILLLAVCAACAQKAHPQARVEPPPALAVPDPPPRLIVPPQPEPSPAPAGDTEPTTSTRPRPSRPAPRPDRPEPARTDTQPDQSRLVPPETQPTPAQSPDLQPVDAAGVTAIRQQMSRASQNLTRVNYARLSTDLKAQYDTASRFLALAEQALKERNLLFASTLADKAGAIASLLTSK